MSGEEAIRLRKCSSCGEPGPEKRLYPADLQNANKGRISYWPTIGWTRGTPEGMYYSCWRLACIEAVDKFKELAGHWKETEKETVTEMTELVRRLNERNT